MSNPRWSTSHSDGGICFIKALEVLHQIGIMGLLPLLGG